MPTDKLRAHLARLIEGLRETGLCLLDQMEAEGEITHDDRRLFQYIFCCGMGDAHFIMAKPKEALASHRSISKDRRISSTIESSIRMRAEDLLGVALGQRWRDREFMGAELELMGASFYTALTDLRKALRAKPSEVRVQLDQRVVVVTCPRCHVPGHTADECKLVPPRGTPRSDAHRGGTL